MQAHALQGVTPTEVVGGPHVNDFPQECLGLPGVEHALTFRRYGL